MQVKTHPVGPEELMAFLDGETPVQEREQVARHLGTCRICHHLAADLQSVERNLQAWREEANEDSGIPEALSIALTQRLTKPLRSNGWIGRLHSFHALTVSGASVLALVAVTFVIQSGKQSKPAPAMAEQSRALTKYQVADAADIPTGATSLLVVRTAALTLTSSHFETARTQVEQILDRFGGHVAELEVSSPAGGSRFLTATLRIPANRLDAALNEIRKLGHVEGESQGGEEVTQRYVDIEARLANARRTESRLAEILQTKTGKLSDVLEVEQQLDKVRGEIETTEAGQKALRNQITLATLQLKVNEEYRATFLTGFGEAGISGLKTAARGLMATVLWLMQVVPSLLLIAGLLFFPARMIWRRRKTT